MTKYFPNFLTYNFMELECITQQCEQKLMNTPNRLFYILPLFLLFDTHLNSFCLSQIMLYLFSMYVLRNRCLFHQRQVLFIAVSAIDIFIGILTACRRHPWTLTSTMSIITRAHINVLVLIGSNCTYICVDKAEFDTELIQLLKLIN